MRVCGNKKKRTASFKKWHLDSIFFISKKMTGSHKTRFWAKFRKHFAWCYVQALVMVPIYQDLFFHGSKASIYAKPGRSSELSVLFSYLWSVLVAIRSFFLLPLKGYWKAGEGCLNFRNSWIWIRGLFCLLYQWLRGWTLPYLIGEFDGAVIKGLDLDAYSWDFPWS